MVSIKLSENNGKAPEAVPYMPAGLNHISCTVNGRAGRRSVMADEAACERLNADLQEMIQASAAGGRARPVVLFDHKAGPAAAEPQGFEWDDKRGILLRVKWTQAGREAVEGGNYGYISPAFRLEKGGQRISGLNNGVEVGSLVNDPAFERNECIAASKAEPEDEELLDVVLAANPYGCNQYGHGWKMPHDGFQGKKEHNSKNKTKDIQKEMQEAHTAWEKANENYVNARNKVIGLQERIEKEPDKEKSDKLYEEKRKAQQEWKQISKELDDAIAKYKETSRRYRQTDQVKACNLSPLQNVEKVDETGENIEAANGGGEENQPDTQMETIKKELGLPPEATAADIAAAIAKLKKSGDESKKRIEEVEAECGKHKDELKKHKETAANGFVERLKKDGKVSPKDEETLKAAREAYLENPERTERIYASMQPIIPAQHDDELLQANKVPTGGDYANMSIADCYANINF